MPITPAQALVAAGIATALFIAALILGDRHRRKQRLLMAARSRQLEWKRFQQMQAADRRLQVLQGGTAGPHRPDQQRAA